MTDQQLSVNTNVVIEEAARLESAGYQGAHGSNGYRYGCRCEPCRRGHAERVLAFRRRRNPPKPVEFPNPEIRDKRVPDRIWTKVRVADNGCWIWTGFITAAGYGRTNVIGNKHRTTGVHRLIYEQMVGSIPADLELDYLCRNPPCCNPQHMEAVTHRINIMRSESLSALNARKAYCLDGHPLSGDNLRILKSGSRACVACSRRRMAERKAAVGIEEWRRLDRERYHARKKRRRATDTRDTPTGAHGGAEGDYGTSEPDPQTTVTRHETTGPQKGDG